MNLLFHHQYRTNLRDIFHPIAVSPPLKTLPLAPYHPMSPVLVSRIYITSASLRLQFYSQFCLQKIKEQQRFKVPLCHVSKTMRVEKPCAGWGLSLLHFPVVHKQISICCLSLPVLHVVAAEFGISPRVLHIRFLKKPISSRV